MSGESDLGALLRGLEVARRKGEYVYTQIPPGQPLPDTGVEAVISEQGGATVVLREGAAAEAGLDGTFRCVWLTLTPHSSLAAVGLTAAVSTALAVKGIPCNVLAGHDQDHLLVPPDRALEAVDALRALRDKAVAEAGSS